MSEQKDNFWRNTAIFLMIWLGGFPTAFGLIDSYLVNHYFTRALCEFGFYIPTEDSKAFCERIGANIK